MIIPAFFFYMFSVIAIAFSILVIANKNPVTSAFSLVLVFFATSGIYALMGAHLIAALQVLVYAGAITVLFVFVIMLLNADRPAKDLFESNNFFKAIAILGVVSLAAAVIFALKNSQVPFSVGPYTSEAVREAGGNTKVLSEVMFSNYILPFEVTGMLLLAGIVGVISIAMRKKVNTPKE